MVVTFAVCNVCIVARVFTHPDSGGFRIFWIKPDLRFGLFLDISEFFQIFPDFILVKTQSCSPPPVSLLFFRNEQNFFAVFVHFFCYICPTGTKKSTSKPQSRNIHRIEHLGIIALELPCARHSCGKTGPQKGSPDFPEFFRIIPRYFFLPLLIRLFDLQCIPIRSPFRWFAICHQVPMAVKHDRW